MPRTPPPIQHALTDSQGALTMPWTLFMNSMYEGDAGEAWIPQFTDLTQVGSAQFAGRIYKLSNHIALFRATVIPGTDTSAIAGTTYINNFPMTLVSDGPCFAVTPPVAAIGACVQSTNRIYVPGWTSIPVPVTITGIVEAR